MLLNDDLNVKGIKKKMLFEHSDFLTLALLEINQPHSWHLVMNPSTKEKWISTS